MEYHNHLFVACATTKKIAENPDFIRLLGKNLSSLLFSRVFLHNTSVGQTFKIRHATAIRTKRSTSG